MRHNALNPSAILPLFCSVGLLACGSGGSHADLTPGPSCKVDPMCQGMSCCTSYMVPGGTFQMGRGTTGSNACPNGLYASVYNCDDGSDSDQPQHPATVATFYLDAFQVTVGRFRNFVDQFDGKPPAPTAGAHADIPGSGWDASWNQYLPASRADLISRVKSFCSATNDGTWTDSPAGNETYAINCVDWYTAFAFCIWDGGYLPTEAEWEYAAAGGTDERMFPWGSTDPSTEMDLANDSFNDGRPFVAVGSNPAGNGKWGHFDLAGGEQQWVLDGYYPGWYAGGGSNCDNCVDMMTYSTCGTGAPASWCMPDPTGQGARVLRGGGWYDDSMNPIYLRAAYRGSGSPLAGGDGHAAGLRCARPTPP